VTGLKHKRLDRSTFIKSSINISDFMSIASGHMKKMQKVIKLQAIYFQYFTANGIKKQHKWNKM